MKKALLFSGLLLAVNVLFAQWTTSGNDVYPSNAASLIGIGTTTPGFIFDVVGVMRSYGCLIAQENESSPTLPAIWVRGWTSGNENASIELQSNNDNGTSYYVIGGTNDMMLGALTSTATLGAINIDYQNHVGIGTTNTESGYLFSVAGTAVFDGVTVESYSSNKPGGTPWADYVFDKSYQLPSIYSVAEYIKSKNHLPGIPTTEEVKKNGLDLGAIQSKLLEKIEQLTLYTIQLQQQVDTLKAENKKFTDLQHQIDELNERSR